MCSRNINSWWLRGHHSVKELKSSVPDASHHQNLVCISFSSSARLSFFIQSGVKLKNRSLDTEDNLILGNTKNFNRFSHEQPVPPGLALSRGNRPESSWGPLQSELFRAPLAYVTLNTCCLKRPVLSVLMMSLKTSSPTQYRPAGFLHLTLGVLMWVLKITSECLINSNWTILIFSAASLTP